MTELELALAQDAASTAFFPLVDAYLEQKRFMEAMVVCKKRIKSQPDELEARAQLAMVYVRQNKVSRALQEMDDVVSQNASSPLAHLARGRIRLEAGDTDGGVEDLKKAIDLDGELEDAQALLAEQGIIYPEPEPEPEPVAPPTPPVMPSARPGTAPPLRGDVSVRPASGLPPQLPPRPGTGEVPSQRPLSSITGEVSPRAPSGMMIPPGPARLEGEDELEAMARRVADERPKKGGSAKTTMILLGGCMLALLVGVGWALRHKHITEGIDRLSQEARPLFDEDTYGGYRRAAERYRDIIKDFSSKHKLTLGRYANTLAILHAEHRDADKKAELDEILARAKKYAPDVSYTVAAEGLVLLHENNDRVAAAQKAYNVVAPFVKKVKEKNGPPSVANLTLGIIEMELGNYESAVDELTMVTQAMPQSVRGRVWLAKAKLRAGDLPAAAREYGRAIQSSKNHLGALAGRALVRVRQGNMEGAGADVKAFEDYARTNPKEVSPPDDALIKYARSEAFRSNGMEERASGQYEEAVSLDPSNADFPHGLGKWLLKAGRAKEALEPLEKAYEMEPTRKAFVLTLADAEIQTGALSKAEGRIEKLLAERPKDLEVALAKARLLRAKNDASVEKYLQDVLEWSKDAVMAQRELGEYYRATGKTKAAEDILSKAVNSSARAPATEQAQVLLSYGRLTEEKGEVGTACNTYALSAEKGSIEALYRACSACRFDRNKAKGFCARYIAAGASLPYADKAEEILRGL